MSESPKISNAEAKEASVPSEGQEVAPMAEQAAQTPQTAPQTDKYAKLKQRFARSAGPFRSLLIHASLFQALELCRLQRTSRSIPLNKRSQFSTIASRGTLLSFSMYLVSI